MKIKTIDINTLEWFDRIYGNSYFAGKIILNYGMKTVKRLVMPFQYGCGSLSIDMAKKQLNEHNYISVDHMENLWTYCEKNKIILRTSKKENCLKRELTNFS